MNENEYCGFNEECKNCICYTCKNNACDTGECYNCINCSGDGVNANIQSNVDDGKNSRWTGECMGYDEE